MSLPSSFFKSTGIYAAANICNKAVGFLMLPLYTQFLTPEDYGVVALLVFALTIFQTLFGTRLGLAIPKFYHAEKSEGRDPNIVISSAFILTSIISVLLTVILFAYKDFISTTIFGSNDYALMSGIFFSCLLPQSVEVYGFVYLRIVNKPKLYLYISLVKLFSQVALNIYLIVILELGAFGIVLSTVISSAIFGIYFAAYLIYETGYKFKWQPAKEMIFFCWPLWFSTLSALYIWTSNRYFVRIYGSLEDVGLIELSAKFASILVAIFWEPFMLYWSTERYNIYYDKTSNKAVYQRTFEMASILLIFGVIGISLFSDFIIQIMSDESFHQASVYIPALVLGSLFYALAEFNNLGFMVKNKTKIIAYIDTFVAIVLTLLYIVLIPKFGLIGAAYAVLIAQFMQYLLYTGIVKKYFDMELKTAFLNKLIIVAIVCILVNDLTSGENIFYNLCIQAGCFISACTVMFWLFYSNNDTNKELINKLIKR